jgi:putative Ca2+/H+ antiporter (TMEM165/GDT1 family)
LTEKVSNRMDWQVFWVTFSTVFLAEMGDKTQLAALTLTAEKGTPLAVLTGACSALFLATLLGVLLGGILAQYIPPMVIRKAAGLAFVVIGGLILLGKW